MNQLTYGNINDQVVKSMDPPGRSWLVSMLMILGALSMGMFAWAVQIEHGLEWSGINHPIAWESTSPTLYSGLVSVMQAP